MDIPADRFEACRAVLSSEERVRAGKYHFEKDRRQFVIARGLLRILLAEYLDLQAAEIEFGFEKFGKPFLNRGNGDRVDRVHFNVAHSGNHILFGFSPDGEIGVDVEELRVRNKPLLDLANSICTPAELQYIKSLSPGDAEIALSRLWTAKEAFLKAIGTGLQIEPDQIEVQESVLLGESHPSCVRRMGDMNMENSYVLYPLPDCESKWNCSAALAVSCEVQVIWRNLI